MTAHRSADGMPDFLKWAESLTVGGAMLSPRANAAACGLDPADFHDRSLGTIWQAILDAPEPSVVRVAALLLERGELDEIGGEPRLVALVSGQTFVYAGLPTMLAHAGVVREWAGKRRRLAELGEEAQRVMSGRRNWRDLPEYQGEV